MRHNRHGSGGGRVRPTVLAFLAATVLAACAPQDGDGRLSVRTLEVRATGADGTLHEGGAIDSTWTLSGDVRQLTRSLVLEPGDPGETPNRLVDLALGALVTGFAFTPPSDAEIAEGEARGLIEIPLQQPIAFRTIVTAAYRRGEDMTWRGSGRFGGLGEPPMRWIDGTVTPADTLRLSLEGDYEDARDAAGGREAVLSGSGTLYVASAGEYAVELTERVVVAAVPSAQVLGRLGDAREEMAPPQP